MQLSLRVSIDWFKELRYLKKRCYRYSMSRKVFSRISWRTCANVTLSRAKGDNFLQCQTLENAVLRVICHNSSLTRELNVVLRTHTLKCSSGKGRYFQHSCTLMPKSNYASQSISNPSECKEAGPSYIDTKDIDTLEVLRKDMAIIEDFITEQEEQEIFKEIEPYLKRLKYQSSHWDDAIHEYRETERKKWTEQNMAIFQRVRDVAFPPGTPQLAFVHVLDLKKEGKIKPHVDAVKFCGNTIAGISLLSTAVMRLVNTEDKTKSADILLKQRSLYIMKDAARYDFTHEVLGEEDSTFRGEPVPRDRRISVICRNEPET